MSYSFNQAAFADGIQEMHFSEVDAISGGAGAWADLGPAVLGGMVGGATGGAITGFFVGGPDGAGIGAVGGAIGGGVGAILTWYTIRAV